MMPYPAPPVPAGPLPTDMAGPSSGGEPPMDEPEGPQGPLPTDVPAGPPLAVTLWKPWDPNCPCAADPVDDDSCAATGGMVVVDADGNQACFVTQPGEASALPPGFKPKNA